MRVLCLVPDALQRYCDYDCPATASSLMRATAGFVYSNVVDVYNGATGAWSTAQLSLGRYNLAAASVGNVALFAGGVNGGALLCKGGGVRGILFIAVCVF